MLLCRALSVYPHPRGPAGLFLVDMDLVRKRIRLCRRDGRYVVFVRVDVCDDLHDGPEQRGLHCLPHLGSLWLNDVSEIDRYIYDLTVSRPRMSLANRMSR